MANGYSASEFNGNIGQSGTFNPATLNTGGGAITFLTSASFGGTGYLSTLFAAGVGNKFGAGSFTFSLAGTATPEPATLGTIAFGILALGAARFRRKI